MFTLYNHLGLYDTVLGIVLFHAAFGLPFAIFLLRNFFVGIPKDILESARIDGASEIRIFLRLILPLGLPAIASLAIFQFLWTWNDLIVALTFGAERPADHGRDLQQPAPVRRQHRPDRARVVHLAARPAGRVLRVPALLRPGTARRLGEVAAGDGLTMATRSRSSAAGSRDSPRTRRSRHGGVEPERSPSSPTRAPTRQRRGGGEPPRSASAACAPRATATACRPRSPASPYAPRGAARSPVPAAAERLRPVPPDGRRVPRARRRAARAHAAGIDAFVATRRARREPSTADSSSTGTGHSGTCCSRRAIRD